MKKRSLVFLISLMLLGVTTFGQNSIKGTWYTYLRKGLMFKITDDSVASKIVGLGFFDSNKKLEGANILKIIKQNGYEYYCFADTVKQFPCIAPCPSTATPSKLLKYSFHEFRSLKNGEQVFWVSNVPDSSFKSMEALQEYIQKDTGSKIGITLYNKAEILYLRSLTPIDSISLEKYKVILKKIKEEAIAAKAKLNGYGAAYYMYFKMRDIFKDNGYNPFFDDDQFADLYNQFKDDPEVKAFFEEN